MRHSGTPIMRWPKAGNYRQLLTKQGNVDDKVKQTQSEAADYVHSIQIPIDPQITSIREVLWITLATDIGNLSP